MIYKYTVGNKNLIDLNDYHIVKMQIGRYVEIIDLLKNKHRQEIEA